jgi:hypothetical protein
MSSQYISLNIDIGDSGEFSQLDSGINTETSLWSAFLNILTTHRLTTSHHDKLLSIKPSILLKNGALDIEWECGSSFSLDTLEGLIVSLDSAGIERYHARLFDSSCGGSQVWDKPERDISLFESKIWLIGEFDEDDDVESTIDDQGGEIVESIAECNLGIIGENPDPKQLKQAYEMKLSIISEEEFWDYVE